MNIYIAHVIETIEYKNDMQDFFPVYENILLIFSDSAIDARQKAKDITVKSYIADETLELNDKPAKHVFQGVKKIIEKENIDLTIGLEKLSQVEMEFKSEKELDLFMSDKEVDFLYLG